MLERLARHEWSKETPERAARLVQALGAFGAAGKVGRLGADGSRGRTELLCAITEQALAQTEPETDSAAGLTARDSARVLRELGRQQGAAEAAMGGQSDSDLVARLLPEAAAAATELPPDELTGLVYALSVLRDATSDTASDTAEGARAEMERATLDALFARAADTAGGGTRPNAPQT